MARVFYLVVFHDLPCELAHIHFICGYLSYYSPEGIPCFNRPMVLNKGCLCGVAVVAITDGSGGKGDAEDGADARPSNPSNQSPLLHGAYLLYSASSGSPPRATLIRLRAVS